MVPARRRCRCRAAEYRLANLYEKGTGVARDLDKAKALYEAAADRGNASAMHNLAVLLATGSGTNPDFKAAANGSARPQTSA